MYKTKTVYALGFFDGVHLGHQALLAACRELAQEHGMKPGVLTFTVHPDGLVGGAAPALINSVRERRLLLSQFGMAAVVCLPFDTALRSMSWRDFIRMLCEKYGACGFVCGNDFRFGFKGEGTAAILAQYCKTAGMPCQVVPEQRVNGIRVSSTHIRRLLEAGEMREAVTFLGHPHMLSGEVTAGRQLGRTLGIPTANLRLPEGIVVPGYGVYACEVLIGEKKYLAVTNVGVRPTVGGSHVTVEPWILDFEGDLYGKEITLLFHQFLRPEQTFGSLEALQAEIRKNAAQTREFFGKK